MSAGVTSPPNMKGGVVQLALMQIACAYAVQAIKAKENSAEAWSYLCDAYHWVGFLQGSEAGHTHGAAIELTKFAMAGARGRDEKYQPLRDFVRSEVTKKNYKSKRNAALSLKADVLNLASQLGIGLSEPQAEKTISGWLDGITFAGKKVC